MKVNIYNKNGKKSSSKVELNNKIFDKTIKFINSLSIKDESFKIIYLFLLNKLTGTESINNIKITSQVIKSISF